MLVGQRHSVSLLLRAMAASLLRQGMQRGRPGLSRWNRLLSSGGKLANDDGDEKILRSVLYMPASRDGALRKIASIPADGFILDLEDAVAPDVKPEARDKAVAAVEHYRSDAKYDSKRLIIRVNGQSTEWHQSDVDAVVSSKADALLLPKVEDVAIIQKIEQTMIDRGNQDMKIWCMCETPLGILNVQQVAAASDRVECLVMGTVDLANELHCLPAAPGRWNMQFALNQVVTAGRAYQKIVLDGVYINLKDEEGLRLECRQGRELGFDGKTLIHPNTVEVANEIFSPTPSEIEHAHRVVQAHIDAVAEGAGCATLDGKLVEALHVRDALRVIKLGQRISGQAA